MKLLRELASLAPHSDFDVGAEEYVYPNVYKDRGKIGAKTKIKKRSVIVRRSSDGRVYGKRTTWSK
jgi:hypothetical protein